MTRWEWVNGFVKVKALGFAYGSFKECIYCPLTRATGRMGMCQMVKLAFGRKIVYITYIQL